MSSWETTPLSGPDLQWWELYAKARATIRWEIVDRGDAASRAPVPWPRMVGILDGMRLAEPESEPEPAPTFLQKVKARFGR